MFLLCFLVCILVRACRFRFTLFCNGVLHFRFAYRIVCSDGMMGFDFDAIFARHDGLHEFG